MAGKPTTTTVHFKTISVIPERFVPSPALTTTTTTTTTTTKIPMLPTEKTTLRISSQNSTASIFPSNDDNPCRDNACNVFPDRFIPDRVIPDRFIPDRVIPDRFIPDRVVPDRLIPDRVIPDRFIPDRVVLDWVVPDKVIPDKVIPDGVFPGNMTNQTMSEINKNGNEEGYLCGFPGICRVTTLEIYSKCANTTLLHCDECGVSRGALFLFFVVCLGVGIIIGNILIILVGYRRHKKGKQTKMDICRISLAAADFMAGIQILVVTVYNFSWSMNLTPLELDAQQLTLRGSTKAIAGGILHTFIFTSSLYHLIYMGMERLYAISKPLKYKQQSTESVYIGLGLVWMLALVTASIPAWFPEQITFTYVASSFGFSTSPMRFVSSNQSYSEVIALVILFYLVPYCLMTASSITTGVLINQRITSRKLKTSNMTSSHAIDKQATKAYWTVAIMQIGFTVTLVPVAVVIALVYSGGLDCSNLSQPYLGCFYASMTNSLINVIIYNLRDKEFRSEVAAILKRPVSWELPSTLHTDKRFGT